jgi:hypothetical protein
MMPKSVEEWVADRSGQDRKYEAGDAFLEGREDQSLTSDHDKIEKLFNGYHMYVTNIYMVENRYRYYQKAYRKVLYLKVFKLKVFLWDIRF